MDLIIEIGIIFIAAALLAYIGKLFKQPIIPAYILAGLLLVLTGVVKADGFISTVSTLGIAFLLFLVGLEIDLKRIADVGIVSTLGGTVLCIFLFWIGFFVAGFMGLAVIEAVYIGLVMAFSSTMIVVKLLADKSELDTLHGRIILGMLLLQDLLAIIAMFVLSSLGDFSFMSLAGSLSLLIGIFASLYVLSKYVFPLIFKYAAKTEELLFISSVAVCLLFIAIFHYLGFSIAIGAFLAGIALGNLAYNIEIISLIKPLRDFFAVIFFVSLGMLLDIQGIGAYIILIITLVLLTILIKPFLIMAVVSLFGYKEKPAFLTSILLGQASEFSMILLLLGLSLGHIGQGLFSSIIVVTILTMVLTAYLAEYDGWIYKKLSRYLKVFEKISEKGTLEYIPEKIKKEVVLAGYDRLGYNILDTLVKLKHNFIVVDYNPEIIRYLVNKKIPCIYGDVGDAEVLHRLNLKDVKMIVSTVPDREDNLMLIKKAKEANKNAIVLVTALKLEVAMDLYEAGADYVILPHFLGGERVSLFLEEVKGDMKKVIAKKVEHLRELKKRRHLGHHRHKKR